MTDEQRLRQISELCGGQAFAERKSVAEVMAEHIIVRDNRIADLVKQVRDYEDALCKVHHGIDHPDGKTPETASFYMAVGWYGGIAEKVLDVYGLIEHEPSEVDEG